MVCKMTIFVKGVANMFFNDIINNRKTSNRFYFNSIQKAKQLQEYHKNQKQIEFITKTLVEHADVPQEIIELLIEYVEKNANLAYKLSKY